METCNDGGECGNGGVCDDCHQDVLNQDWFLLGQPWAQSDYADFAVMAGSNDPHQGVMLLDMHDAIDDDELGDDTRRAIAAHIVETHNNSIRELSEDKMVKILQKLNPLGELIDWKDGFERDDLQLVWKTVRDVCR